MTRKSIKLFLTLILIAALMTSGGAVFALTADEAGTGSEARVASEAGIVEKKGAADKKPATPEYTAKAVTGADGLTDEYTYSFPSGDITLAPNRNQTMLMVNGEFLPYLVEIRENRSLVPLRFAAQAFDAAVDWDGDTATVTIVAGDTTATIVIGEKYARIQKGDKRSEQDLYTPAIIINDRAYVPVRAVSEIFDKDAGYESGGIVTENPFVWIDEKTPDWKPDIGAIKALYQKSLDTLKENIATIEDGAFKDWGEVNARTFGEIQRRIDNIVFTRHIGRYAFMGGPYRMLVGRDGTIYFYTTAHAAFELAARSFDDPGLLLPGYFLGGFPDDDELASVSIYGRWDYAHTTVSDEKGGEKPYIVHEFRVASPYIDINADGSVVCVFYESRSEGTLARMAPGAYAITDITANSEGETYSVGDVSLTYNPQSGFLRYALSDGDVWHYFRKK